MAMPHKRRKLAAGLLLFAAVGVLQYIASLPIAPAITPETARARKLFPLDFTLPDLQGNAVRLSDLRGKVVLINFWATWCYPCRTEMPSLEALYQDYWDQGFEILAIAIDVQGKAVVVPFVEAFKLTFPVLLAPHNDVGTRLQVSGIPTSYLLDKHGRIATREVGPRDWNSQKMRRLLDQLLREEARGPTS